MMSDTPEEHKITIDRRPLWIVALDRMRGGVLVAVFFALFFIFLNLEPPSGLTTQAYRVLCLFLLCVCLWSTNVIPLSATSLLAIAMVPLLGVMEASEAYSFFGNKAVFFILGTFILSGAMIATGLSTRLSLAVMERWGHDPRSLVTSIYFFGAICSCFMSEHAVAAMLFPIVKEIADALKLPAGRSVYGKALFFAMAWGCIIGGTATVMGGARVPLAVEILEKTTQYQSTLGVLQYSQLAIPLVLLLLAGGWAVLTIGFRPDIEDIRPALDALRQKHARLGKVSFQEAGVGMVMAITVFFWFVYGESLGIANIALLAIVALFIMNLITWELVEPHVNWAIILMYGGAICLGEVMASSGAALWLAQQVFEGFITSSLMFLVTLAVLSTLFTTIMSNAAVIAILLPPALSLCSAYGISPAVATLTVVLPSNFAFILPIATPASALAYSSRYITIREMMTMGGLLSLVGIGGYLFLNLVYWPLLGFR